jgi:hypothetical protein
MKVLVVSLFALFGLFFLLNTGHAAAAAPWCGVLAYAPDGNCQDGQNYTALTDLNADAGNSNKIKADFISDIQNYQNNGQGFEKIGAKYIEDGIEASGCGNWVNCINQSNVTAQITTYYTCNNSAYDPASNTDIAYGNDCGTYNVVAFEVGGVKDYTVKLDCGNPLGVLPGLPKSSPPVGNLTLTCSPSSGYTAAGYNPDDSTADVSYQIRFDSSSGGVDDSGTTNKGNTTFHSDSWTTGRNYVLLIQDQSGNFQQVDNALGPNCGVTTGGSASGGGNCQVTTGYDPGSISYVTPSGSPPANSNGTTYWDPKDVGTSVASQTFVNVSDSSGTTLVNNQKLGGTDSRGLPGPTNGYWSYTPQGAVVNISINHQETARYYYTTKKGTVVLSTWATYSTVGSGSIGCYSASCQIVAYGGTGPEGQIIEGQPYYAYAVLTDTSTQANLPASIGSWPLSVTGGTPNSAHPVGQVNIGQSSAPVLITGTAPASSAPGYFSVGYPDYNGDANIINTYGFGSSCTVPSEPGNPTTIPVYYPFSLSVNAHINPTDSAGRTSTEDPVNIGYDTEVINSSSYTINGIPSNSSFTDNAANLVPPDNTSGPYNASATTYTLGPATYSPPTIKVGDTYCSNIYLSSTGGVIGPSGDIGPNYVPAQDNPCFTVDNEPYVHYLGTDVESGGGFGTTSCTTPGGIHAYTDDLGPQPRGSGSQFGVEALGVIEGFNSANLRTSSPTGSTGLSFSNTKNISGSAPGTPEEGGDLATSSSCVPDYFSYEPTSGITSIGGTFNNSDISTTAGQNGYEFKPGVPGTLTIGGDGNPLVLQNGVNTTIYSYGDVVIDSNITYAGASASSAHPWSSLADIPSFTIYAKGNIYIDPGVTNLDGSYVAEPSGASAGYINTCADSASTYNITQVYGSCKSQLTVNGSLMAQNLYLDRSYSSLRYGVAGENNITTPSHSCGIAGTDVPASQTSANDCAAEIISSSPETYLAKPDIDPSSGPTVYRYDDVTDLPPIL